MIEGMNVEELKITFLTIVGNYIKRDGIESLVKYLESSDFFVAPASSRFHSSYPGGLCKHSLYVFERLVKEIETEYGSIEDSPYSYETVTIVSLFHDLCKINYYEVYYKNVQGEDGKWSKVPCYRVNEKLPIAHGYKSQYILRSFINLSREESVAIMSHMGGFDATVRGGDNTISAAFEKYPLALLLHIADMKASKLDEPKEKYIEVKN